MTRDCAGEDRNGADGLFDYDAGFNATFDVWMMESFFREIPSELEEAAMSTATPGSPRSAASSSRSPPYRSSCSPYSCSDTSYAA